MAHLQALLGRFTAGDAVAASRLMTTVERGGADAERVLDAVYARTGRAHRIALTGPGGAGKSTLINELTRAYRGKGRSVGVVAQDPSSPFSGGAVLGDRIRMTNAGGDPGVFVRSLASRGNLAALSPLASELADVLDAFGRDIVILESMGASQVETRIRFSADTVVLVLTPEAGDEIQTLKAGLLEIADVVAVNKADRGGAESMEKDIEAVIDLRGGSDSWRPSVVRTSVRDGMTGADPLFDAVQAHAAHLDRDGRRTARRREALRARMQLRIEEAVRASLWQSPILGPRFDAMFERVTAGSVSPWQAARELAESLRLDARTSP